MRYRAFKAAMLIVALVVMVTGCRTVTGRSAGTYMDDATTTAKVKTSIASTQIGTLTRVDVDTRHGVVYLTGTAMNEESRQEILKAARSAAEGKPVVDQLVIAQQPQPSASPAGTTATTTATVQPRAGGQQLAAATAPPLTQLKFGRIERDTGGPGPLDRWVAYDQQGQQVATVYTIPAGQLRPEGMAALDTGERRIDHVSIHPDPGRSQYHVVLWHVSREEAARLQ